MVDKSIIRQILIDQQDECRQILKRCDVERDCEAALVKGLSDDLIKVITGVRRCGKSALAHRALSGETYGYVNFDDERLFDVTANDLNTVLEVLTALVPGMRYILLDEIQNIERWELFVNRLQRQGYRVVLTGSNAHLLSRELASHLTGRNRVTEVYPYSFREYLRKLGCEPVAPRDMNTSDRGAISEHFMGYFQMGGFPELGHVENSRVYLQDLYDRVLTRDIAMRHGVRHIRTLKDIAFHVANNCGGKLTYQGLALAYGLGSVHTAKNYLSYFQEAYLFFALEAFSFKVKERVRRPRKLYGIDPALVRAASASMRDNTGLLLENVVFIELLRRGQTVSYYADPQGRYEVDFVSRDQAGGEVQLIQVCSDMTREETRIRELRGLCLTARQMGSLPDANLRVLTLDHRATERVDGREITCTPVWEWMLE